VRWILFRWPRSEVSTLAQQPSRPDDDERAFAFLRTNPRGGKPRSRGITEIRGPYYTPMGPQYLEDLLRTMGAYVDALKFAGGSFALMTRGMVRELIELAHRHQVEVSTGGFIEHVLARGGVDGVEAYLGECKELGFDVVEVSAGFITLPIEDWCALVKRIGQFGMKAKAEVGIQFGAGGASTAEALEAVGTGDVGWMIQRARRLLEAGAYMLMIESEGITESVKAWRTEVPARVIGELGLERVMFEAADPEVFAWYVKNYGPGVNLFVDHSQIVQLEALRAGIWGTSELWGRVQSYSP
jgi:phosphosulfolactate synthase (CoM biosynthesis protein A)